MVVTMITMGYRYKQGHSIEKDLRRTVEWHQKAADQGDGAAQYKMDVLPDGDKLIDESEEVKI